MITQYAIKFFFIFTLLFADFIIFVLAKAQISIIADNICIIKFFLYLLPFLNINFIPFYILFQLFQDR
jgi:hypothetical protein